MDVKLRFKQHIAKVSSKALEAAIELKRLKEFPPATARQLFTAMVAPVIDYASMSGAAHAVIKTVLHFAIAPWEERVEAITKDDERIAELANAGWAVRIATRTLGKNSLVGFGAAFRTPISVKGAVPFNLLSVTVATRDEQNPYTAELAAKAKALEASNPAWITEESLSS
ncbi:hypothetical protein SCUP234_12823 [Seiridium cupressi]